MSDAPSLLLNMSADVASATGLNPMQGQSPVNASQGNEFAGVLQSVLKTASPPTQLNPPVDNPLDANPLLLMQTGGLENSLFPQADLQLDAVLTGKDLPMVDVALTGQSVLAEAEGQGSLLATTDMMVSDAAGDLLDGPAIDPILPVKPESDVVDPDVLTDTALPHVSAESMSADKTVEHEINTKSDSLSPINMAMLHPQDAASVAKPMVGGMEGDALSKVARSQSMTAKSINPVDLDVSGVESDVSIEASHLPQDKIQMLSGQTKQDGQETVSNMFDSILADVKENGTLTKPISSTGISTYAAISGSASSLSSVSATTTSPTTAHLTISPQNSAWGEQVGNKVQWMAAQNIQEAKIRLHPQELGMLEVHIQMGKDQQTSISFSSPHVQVREALESAIPRLREMFGETGLSLGDVNVSQHSSSQQQDHTDSNNQPANPSHASSLHGSLESTDSMLPLPTQMQSGDSMLDLYA